MAAVPDRFLFGLHRTVNEGSEGEERLTVRKSGGRKPALGTQATMAIPQRVNQRWSIDFVQDAPDDGRRSRILNVVDDFTRECRTSVLDTSLSGVRVVRELDRLCLLRGRPAMVAPGPGHP
jgi:putative transposase